MKGGGGGEGQANRIGICRNRADVKDVGALKNTGGALYFPKLPGGEDKKTTGGKRKNQWKTHPLFRRSRFTQEVKGSPTIKGWGKGEKRNG